MIRVQTPKHWGFRIWDSKDIIVNNMSSYTQIVPILETPIYDVNKDIPVPTWNIVRLNLTGSEPTRRSSRDSSARSNWLTDSNWQPARPGQ